MSCHMLLKSDNIQEQQWQIQALAADRSLWSLSARTVPLLRWGLRPRPPLLTHALRPFAVVPLDKFWIRHWRPGLKDNRPGHDLLSMLWRRYYSVTRSLQLDRSIIARIIPQTPRTCCVAVENVVRHRRSISLSRMATQLVVRRTYLSGNLLVPSPTFSYTHCQQLMSSQYHHDNFLSVVMMLGTCPGTSI